MLTRDSIGKSLRIDYQGRTLHWQDFTWLIDCWHEWLSTMDLPSQCRVMTNLPFDAKLMALFYACMERGYAFIAPTTYHFAWDNTNSLAMPNLIIVADRSWVYAPNVQVAPNFADYQPAIYETQCRDTDVAMVAFTSGSSGERKLVMHTHRSLAYSAQVAMPLYDIKDRVGLYLMPSHLGHFTVCTLPAFMVGCHIVFGTSTDPRCGAEQLLTLAVDKMMMFPWSWDWTGQTTFSHRPSYFTGGTVIGQNFIANMLARGVSQVHVIYGMTEAPPPITIKTVTPDTLAEYDPMWLGDLMGGWRYQIVDGLLWLGTDSNDGVGFDAKGNSLCQDGWLHTNDACRFTDKLMFIGREYHIRREDQLISVADMRDILHRHVLADWKTDLDYVLIPIKHAGVDYIDLCLRQYVPNLTVEQVNSVLLDHLSPGHTIDHVVLIDRPFPLNGVKLDASLLKQRVDRLIYVNHANRGETGSSSATPD